MIINEWYDMMYYQNNIDIQILVYIGTVHFVYHP